MSIWNSAMADFSIAANINLYDSIWKPIRDLTLNFPRIHVVPDGPLDRMPIEILVSDEDVMKSQHSKQDPRFLVQEHAFSYYSSATMLLASDAVSMESIPQDFVALGDPDVRVSPLNTAIRIESSTLPSMKPQLQAARQEVENIGGESGLVFQRFLGIEATETRLKQALNKSGIVHVAAHAFLNKEDPCLSRIKLASSDSMQEDGALHTYEFAGIRQPIPILILSGCNTVAVSGVANNFTEDAEIRTFPSLVTIGSLWNVEDRLTSVMMKKLYDKVLAGSRVDEALREVKMEAIQEGFSDPYQWGAFILIGRLPSGLQLRPVEPLRKTDDWPFKIAAIVFLAVTAALGQIRSPEQVGQRR
jgi:CHAT domain-containing protein